MHKLVPLLALIAVPALAQPGGAWTVTTQGRTCTATQPTTNGAAERLSVSYDAAAREVVLSGLGPAAVTPPRRGPLQLNLVFLGNGREAYDDAWGKRAFTVAREGEAMRLTTRFAGEDNVAQIFADLAKSQRVGFLKRSGGEPVQAFFLDGLAPALAQLRNCNA